MLTVDFLHPSLPQGKITLSLPTKWEEVATEELAIFTVQQLTYSSGNGEDQFAAARTIIGELYPEYTTYLAALQIHEWVFIIEQFDFLNKSAGYHQPFPHFSHHGVKYLLPSSALLNLILDEWDSLSKVLHQYAEKSDPKLLIKMVAILCRPEELDEQGQGTSTRIEFLKSTYDARAEELKDLDLSVLLPLTNFITDSVRFIKKKFRLVFPEQEEDDDEAAEEVRLSNNRTLGWEEIAFDLATSGAPFGNYQQTMRMNVIKIFQFLQHKINSK